MKVWVLEYFSIGSGTHPCGIWDGCPSAEQIMKATAVGEDTAYQILDDKDEDYSLYEISVPKGEF